MRFIVDAQLPRSLAIWLKEQGTDTIHTLDLPEANKTSDKEIIRLSTYESRIVITKDNDFLKIRILTGMPEKLLMLTTGNIANKELSTQAK